VEGERLPCSDQLDRPPAQIDRRAAGRARNRAPRPARGCLARAASPRRTVRPRLAPSTPASAVPAAGRRAHGRIRVLGSAGAPLAQSPYSRNAARPVSPRAAPNATRRSNSRRRARSVRPGIGAAAGRRRRRRAAPQARRSSPWRAPYCRCGPSGAQAPDLRRTSVLSTGHKNRAMFLARSTRSSTRTWRRVELSTPRVMERR
jgi:hypothetical protein